MTLQEYCAQFSNLTRAPGTLWTDLTRKCAPHKPLLLLAVMDMVARSAVRSKFVSIMEELVELNELFTDYWRSVVPVTHTSSIAFPFSRLHTEPFWKLVPKPGEDITRPTLESITTVTQLRRVAIGAEMDEDLYLHMSGAASRAALQQALLRSCFSEEGGRTLSGLLGIHAEAFTYSRELEAVAHSFPAGEAPRLEQYQRVARDQGFRRSVVFTYNHRCALCGLRIVTPEGHTAVDAAHIVPWSQTKNDDIRNGMALCKLCHWSFDKWLIGVSDAYTVIVSRQLMQEHNMAGRAGPTNLDSSISVISARMGDGIARMDGEDDGKKAEKESCRGVQGAGRTGGIAGRQDVGRARRALRGAPAPGNGMEEAAA